MALGQIVSGTAAHDGSEADALLNHTHLSTDDDGLSTSEESMTARLKTLWSDDKSSADNLANGSSPIFEAPRDSYDLDNANLRAQGHEAALQRSFSPLAALGLGFR